MTVGILSFGCVLYQDGAGAAPSGTPQYPTLLSSYVARAPWNVAGVDYRVGCPLSGLTDIRTSQPAGTTLSGNTLTINSSNVTINGYDFTSGNGVSISCGSNNDLTITNCNFGGSNYRSLGTAPIDFRGQNLTFEYNTLDGGANGTGSQSCLILIFPQSGATAGNAGTLSLRYNWFKNYCAQILDVTDTCTVIYKYNLLDDTTVSSGAHMNWHQWGCELGGTLNTLVAFNTTRQLTVSAGEGYQFYVGNNVTTGTLNAPVCQNNTIVVPNSGSMSNIMHGPVGNSFTIQTGQGLMQSNYFDVRGANDAYDGPTFASGWTISGNINMNTGAAENT